MREMTLQKLAIGYASRLRSKGLEYDRLAKRDMTRPKQGRPQWIGCEAEKAWIAQDLKHQCGSAKLRMVSDPMGAVSNKGDARRTDVLVYIAGEISQFELKKSDYGGSRVGCQLASQVFDLGLGTYAANTLNVIYGEDRRIDVYTREDAERAVQNALPEKAPFVLPKPSQVIHF